MAGTLTISTLSDGTNSTSSTNCIQGSAKAWVNFNGVTTTSIRASYNVSSVTRNATGDYTINFTNALADANYSVVASNAPTYGTRPNFNFNLFSTATPYTEVVPTTTAFRSFVVDGNGSAVDVKYACFSVFR